MLKGVDGGVNKLIDKGMSLRCIVAPLSKRMSWFSSQSKFSTTTATVLRCTLDFGYDGAEKLHPFKWKLSMSANQSITYQAEPSLSKDEFIDVLKRSTLSERRPIAEPGTIDAMLANADLIVTARLSDGTLVGVSRAITDYAYCTYLSDLAVDEAVQKQGIGRKLIDKTHELAGRQTNLILLAAPKARSYYPHIGMVPHDSCWMIARVPKS
jgi:GNAT superfamily N-acetyltransferase